MTDFATQFRAGAAERAKGRRPGGRYPRALREVALHHLYQVRGKGGAATTAARDLGIDPNTLRGWEKLSRASNPRAEFRPVKVIDDKAVEAAYIVVGPAGLRVGCQNAEMVAALFRALA